MRKIAVVSLAVALAGTGVGLQPPTAAAARTVTVKSIRADINGDGHKDSVKVFRIKTASHHRVSYRVTVTTSKGRKSSRTIVTQGVGGDAKKITKPVAAIAGIDGVAGAEIVLTATRSDGAGFHWRTFAILTWREGRLVKEPAPPGGWVASHNLSEGASWRSWLVFDKVGGVRYALTCHDDYVDRVGPQRWFDVAAWVDGKWQAQPSTPITATTDPRCAPASSATLVLR